MSEFIFFSHYKVSRHKTSPGEQCKGRTILKEHFTVLLHERAIASGIFKKHSRKLETIVMWHDILFSLK